jgi:hypothetical protein
MSIEPEHLPRRAALEAFPPPEFDVDPHADIGPASQPETDDGADPDRHLRAVPPRRRRQPRIGMWATGIVSVASLFLLVAFNVFMVQGQFDLDRIAEQRRSEQKRYEALRNQVAKFSAPQVVIAKAKKLGMQDATELKFFTAAVAGRVEPEEDRTMVTQNETRDKVAKGPLDPNP